MSAKCLDQQGCQEQMEKCCGSISDVTGRR